MQLQETSLQEIKDSTQKNQTLDAQNTEQTKLQEISRKPTMRSSTPRPLTIEYSRDIKITEEENNTL
jgi:hypothetical protein